MIPVIIGVSLLVFLVLKMTPGDPARVVAGSEADEATVEMIREELGLNKPVMQQYVDYMIGLLHGDMGESYVNGKPVLDEIAARLPTTFALALASVLVAVIIGIPLGIISATKQYSILDYISTIFALAGVAMPNFWLGLMLILFFSLHLGILPSNGAEDWTGYILPAITMGVGAVASFMRTTRSSMLEVIRQDYIRTAVAKGIGKRNTILRHAFRNTLIPTLTQISMVVVDIITGSLVIEQVFSWPGIGTTLVNSVLNRDFPVIQFSVLMLAAVVILVNYILDILYMAADPRVEAGGEGK